MLGLISVVISGVVESYGESVGAKAWREGMARYAALMAHDGNSAVVASDRFHLGCRCGYGAGAGPHLTQMLTSRISQAESFRLLGKSKWCLPYKSYCGGGERSLPFPAFPFLSLRILRLGRPDCFPFSASYPIRSGWCLLPRSPFLVFLLPLLPLSLRPGRRSVDLAALRGISPIPVVRPRGSGIVPTRDLFLSCFRLCKGQGGYYLTSRAGFRVGGAPSNNKGWKAQFLFVSRRRGWGFGVNWSAHSVSNVPPNLSDEESILVGRLKGILFASRAIRNLTEEWLVEAGLNPASRDMP
ncbi:hypothetical protein B296_00031050 [Ensete ventricosum]|uniref:Uncharacterized protein n=1 Tax=Ensete ventricosum TaxID=4639 RepID=A0A426YKL7_ENSVE|nr:hypothetical protein B296_00031050 [Ensete ventricosum]